MIIGDINGRSIESDKVLFEFFQTNTISPSQSDADYNYIPDSNYIEIEGDGSLHGDDVDIHDTGLSDISFSGNITLRVSSDMFVLDRITIEDNSTINIEVEDGCAIMINSSIVGSNCTINILGEKPDRFIFTGNYIMEDSAINYGSSYNALIMSNYFQSNDTDHELDDEEKIKVEPDISWDLPVAALLTAGAVGLFKTLKAKSKKDVNIRNDIKISEQVQEFKA